MLGHIWSWSRFYNFLRSQEVALENVTDPSRTELSVSVASSSFYYVVVKNPEFGIRDIGRHYYHDKVSDASRSANVAYVVQSVTAPMVMAGPPGMIARAALTLALGFNISHALNMYDVASDLHHIATTKEIGGKRMYGHSVRSR